MRQSVIERVWRRAGAACEYCHLPQTLSLLTFEIDHVIARKHGGRTQLSNLALACYYCNTYKGPNVAGVAPDTGEIVRLFNPRRDEWNEHFVWVGVELQGKTNIGEATIAVLKINHPEFVAMREALLDEGSFPY